MACYGDPSVIVSCSCWMGHKGDIERRYTTNKYRLPPALIEDMRNSYRRSQRYLHSEPSSEAQNTKIEFRRQLLYVVGYSESEVDRIGLQRLSDEEIQLKIKEKLLKSNSNGSSRTNSTRQKVVPLDEVEKYIESGWEYIAQLPNGKAIIKGLDVNGGEPQPQVNPAEKIFNR